jgi:hypothetical protein
MRKLRIVLLACACLCLPACYDFDFPLDTEPRVPVDGRLVGVWRCLAMETDVDEPVALLRIARRSGQVALWTFETPSTDGSTEKAEFDVHGSTVKGGELLNAREIKESGAAKWSFVRYSFLLPDVLRLQVVKDEPFEKVADKAASLRKEVEKRRGDPTIYSDFCVCVRGKPPVEPSPSPTPRL